MELKKYVTALMLALVLLFGLSTQAPAATIEAFVSIPPQEYFLHMIGGERLQVHVMAPAGADPHNYEPKPSQMVAVTKAIAYFAIGADFERTWLDKLAAANPNMRIFQTDKGIEKMPMAAHHHEHGEHHDEAGEHHDEAGEHHDEAEEHHDHSGQRLDPHVWTSPAEARIIARNMFQGLVEVDPAGKAIYESGLGRLLGEIDRVDQALKQAFQGLEDRGFMVFHPAWGYLARTYGLKQIPIELEGKEPKPAQLAELIEKARKNHVRMIFIQPQMSDRSARVVADEIGAKIAIADPLSADWAENLLGIAEKVKEALR